jgi:hypothetical protein
VKSSRRAKIPTYSNAERQGRGIAEALRSHSRAGAMMCRSQRCARRRMPG